MYSCRAFLLAAALATGVCPPLPSQSLSPLQARWSPLGPSLIINAQGVSGQRTLATGRINAVAPNPLNPLGDVWIGSAGRIQGTPSSPAPP